MLTKPFYAQRQNRQKKTNSVHDMKNGFLAVTTPQQAVRRKNTSPVQLTRDLETDVNILEKLYLDTLQNLYLGFENVLFTNTPAKGLDLVLNKFIKSDKDIICTTQPGFAFCEDQLYHGFSVEKILLKGEHYEKLMVGTISTINPEIFILCDPNNATGTRISTGTIEKICSLISGLVVVDETHVEFSDYPSLANILHNHGNLIVVRTLPVAWSMGNTGCGIILANKKIISSLSSMSPPCHLPALLHDRVHKYLINTSVLEQTVARIKSNRTYLSRELAKLPCIQRVYPSHSNFIMVTLNNFDQIYDSLVKQNIKVADNRNLVKNSLKIPVLSRRHNKLLIKTLIDRA